MDCCGSSKPKENDKEAKTGKLSGENNPAQKEHAHAGCGCCGGANGMWLHLVLMIIVVIAISYFTKGG